MLQGEKIEVCGILLSEGDCEDELIMNSVQSIAVRGKVKCSPAVKKLWNIGTVGNSSALSYFRTNTVRFIRMA